MDTSTAEVSNPLGLPPDQELEAQVRSVLEHAVDAQRRGLKVYQSLQNLNEVIGTEYGDRVLYELIQNAHDAHDPEDTGRIAIRLVIQSESDGVLYVANEGNGFRNKDVEAVKNLAVSAKEVGEGIGNKGLGFRSIEALTDDVRIYSRAKARRAERFDGYCFRFADVNEIKDLIRSYGVEPTISEEVARTVPRYLVPRPLYEQSDDIAWFAQRGYATVIAAPLRSAQAVDLATEQVRALAELEVPLLLFLDRIVQVQIEIQGTAERVLHRRLTRRQHDIGPVLSLPGCSMHSVDVGEGRTFLVVRREVDKQRLLRAVEKSLPKAPQLKRWLAWKGQPVVSVAVGLSMQSVGEGRLYNFLPMGKEAHVPLLGYLDAPFFSDIDRRNANLSLPLNEILMEVAAETCVSAALSLIESSIPVPRHATFDLIAWTGDQALKLDNALKGIGSSLRDAKFVPSIPLEKEQWRSLSDIALWPEGDFSLLTAKEVAKCVGATLVSPDLDAQRITRLKQMATRIYRSLSPDGQQLAKWAETFASSLFARKIGLRTWSRFYEDLKSLFGAATADLKFLAHKAIFYDRSGKLRPAGGGASTSTAGIYIRSEESKGKRTKGSIPLPPSTLSRRFHFLDERITLRRETLDAFIDAGLVREYDPIEALVGLKSALGRGAGDQRRREALLWAFQVWRVAGARVEDELRDAELYVPTISGWRPAIAAAFSSSWTMTGRTLENYVVEAADISADCKKVREQLLVGLNEWPRSSVEGKQHWVRFLELIGVAHGLRPVPGQLTRRGTPGSVWLSLLRNGKPLDGLDGDWCAEVKGGSFSNPYTDYQMKGEAWRLPGQIEHEKLPETAREAFCALILEYLKAHGNTHFTFDIGRFDRGYQREWDSRKLPTPLAVFLRTKCWIAANTRDGLGFRRPDECWGARTRRGGPPRFLDRLPETVGNIVDSSEISEVVFDPQIGLRDWQSKGTFIERLKDLASAAAELASNDRPTFRREYQRAWIDATEAGISLPADLSLVVARRGQLEVLNPDPGKRPDVIVTQDAQRFEARILSSAGQAVLEVGDASTDRVAALLQESGAFAPRRLDGIGVQLLVDGASFVPRSADPLLSSLGLDWLPELIVIGHELRGEQLERGILRSTVERRARSIRVRRCEKISLLMEGREISAAERLPCYAFEHEEFPTLILTNTIPLNWANLARLLSGPISRLIDSRFKSLEPLLLRVALDGPAEGLEAPGNEVLARALECDLQTLEDQRAAVRTNIEHVLYMLVPVIAYFAGANRASQLRAEAERAGIRFDAAKWLRLYPIDCERSPEELLNACERASDRAELRRLLELDFGAFNHILLQLGEPAISNEAELKQLYAAYLGPLRPAINDRLRRHYYSDFRAARDLAPYVELKSLAFLVFDPGWVLTRETLERDMIDAHVLRLLYEKLGIDLTVELPPLARVVEANRKFAREFAAKATPIIQVWCRKHSVSVPEVWRSEPQAVVRRLEDSGLLDFEILELDCLPSVCRRADCWPEGMSESIDRSVLGLEESEVEEAEKQRDQERRQLEAARRSIQFAGRSLDTGDEKFADHLRELVDDWLSKDETWFERSRRRVKLAEFENRQPTGGQGGGSGRGGAASRREKQLTDAQREAMGLASEWLAFQFLRRRHGEYVDESSWVSENRGHFFGGEKGDDGAGYDFLVKTPQADWLYEVKSTSEDSGEFELTANELRVASGASKDGRRRYRILYVPYVFMPNKWFVVELPNPMGEATRNHFAMVGRGSVRLRFERQ